MKSFLLSLCLLVGVLVVAIPQSARTPPASYGIAVADLNGDGNLDAVVTNPCTTQQDCTNGSVSVLLGNGDGTFQAGVIYSSGGYGAFRVAIADLNGDGHPDIVVANGCVNISNCSSGSVGVLIGNGDGTFKPAVSYPSGGMYAYSVAIGSLRGTSKLDLIVANVCQSGSSGCTIGAQNLNLAASSFCRNGSSINCANVNGSIGVLLGNGDGTFASAVSYGSGGVAPFSVATGKFSGNLSVVATNSCASTSVCTHGSVTVLLGNGDGTLQSAVAYSTGGLDPEFVVVGDFNGDSKPDLAVVNDCATSFASACPNSFIYSANDSSFSILLGHGDGTFASAVNYNLSSVGWPVSSAAVADVNADGKPDLIIGQRMIGGDVGVILGNGDGTFQSPVFYAGTDYGNTSPVAVGDVNGDGKPDIAYTNLYNYGLPSTGGHWPEDSAYTLLGNGNGTFSATSIIFSPNPLIFGTVPSGTQNETLTVTNLSSGKTAVTFSGTPTITGTGAAQFSVLPYISGSQSTCLQSSPKLQLNPGATCTFTVQFSSTGLGTTYNVTLNISDSGVGGSQPVSMTAKD